MGAVHYGGDPALTLDVKPARDDFELRLLQDKVAIVTGAGGGIGRAIALRFSEEGARVACLDLPGTPLDETFAGGGNPYQPVVDYVDPLFDATPIVDEGGNTNYAFYWSSTTHAHTPITASRMHGRIVQAISSLVLPWFGGPSLSSPFLARKANTA